MLVGCLARTEGGGRQATFAAPRLVYRDDLPMRTYVLAAGAVFALIAVAHVARLVVEPHLATDPWFLSMTVIAAALAVGAWRVSRPS